MYEYTRAELALSTRTAWCQLGMLNFMSPKRRSKSSKEVLKPVSSLGHSVVRMSRNKLSKHELCESELKKLGVSDKAIKLMQLGLPTPLGCLLPADSEK